MPLVRSLSTSILTLPGSPACSCGSCALIALTVPMTLAPGWRCTLRMIAGISSRPPTQARGRDGRRRGALGAIHAGPGAELRVLGAVDDARHVDHPHRRAVLVGDDQVLVVVDGDELVVRIDRVGALGTVEAALGAVRVGRGDRRAQGVEADAVGGERLGVGLDPHRRPLAAARATPGRRPVTWLIFCARRVLTRFCTSVSGKRVGRDRQRQHRRVGRVHLGVDRRRRQVGRQQRAAGVDRRLHLLLGDVEGQAERELQGDDRDAGGAGRAHPVEPGHLPELAFERRGDGVAHHLGAAARIERLHLDRRIVDLRQRRERQEAKADETGEDDRQHQQRSRHRPLDEGT